MFQAEYLMTLMSRFTRMGQRQIEFLKNLFVSLRQDVFAAKAKLFGRKTASANINIELNTYSVKNLVHLQRKTVVCLESTAPCF